MSEETKKTPLLNIAASLAATIKCCVSADTATTTTITDNAINGADVAQTITPLVKSASTMSTDLTPIAEETEGTSLENFFKKFFKQS